MLRTALAIMVAPLPAALFQSVLVGLFPKEGGGVSEHPFSMFVTIYIFFYIFGVVIGVPAHAIARKRQKLNLRTYMFIGMLVALLPVGAALVWAAMQGHASAYIVIYSLTYFGLGGTAAGWIFWKIPRRTQPAVEQVFA